MRRLVAVVLALLLVPSLAAAQKAGGGPAALTLGTATDGTTSGSAPAKFRVTISGAGVLTVAANGEGDLTLAVTDEDGQALRDGTADTDHRGQLGLEYLATPIPRAGTYVVEVRVNGSGNGVPFRVVANFVAMTGFEVAADPDGSPRTARALAVGSAQEESLNPDAGDLVDWYVVTATEAMTLILVTRVEDDTQGDIVLEAFLGDDLSESVARSDQDLRGNAGNESLTVDVKAGETVRFKVASLGDSGGALPYRVSLGKMP